MLVERARCGRRGLSFLLAVVRLLAAALMMAILALPAHGADYDIRTISQPTTFSRDPVISETKLIVWSAYDLTSTRETQQYIMIHSGGMSRTLFTLPPADLSASLRPQVQSNIVVFVAVMPPPQTREAWKLRQVPTPERDQPVRELPAVYRLESLKEGRQEWSPVSPEELEQQASASVEVSPSVESVGDTNVVAEPSAAPSPESIAQGVVTGEEAVATGVVAEATTPPPVAKPEPPVAEPPPDEAQLKDIPRRFGSGDTELLLWRGGEVIRITGDNRDDLGPSVWGNLVAWQTAKAWPFGWEIMAWTDGQFIQLTTNFYYDMAPRVQENRIVWYGWDGHDFEVFLYDHAKSVTVQITSNLYDDISPDLWGDVIVWEGYASANADIFMWRDGKITKLSNNVEDDLNPRTWNGKVVWQGFDGEDYEIFYFDGEKTTRLTSNTYDDVNPEIRDGVICWMGYEGNWDAEIYVWNGGPDAKRLTDNDDEDRMPRTASGWVVWESVSKTQSVIQVAEPRK